MYALEFYRQWCHFLSYHRVYPGTAVQTGEWDRRTPPGRRGLRRAGTPWPSVMSCRLWPHPRRRSRCLSLGPQPPPPPRGPEDVRLSRSRPRWGPGREKTSGSELRRNREAGGVEGTLQRDCFTAGRSQSEVFCASSFHKEKTLFREWLKWLGSQYKLNKLKEEMYENCQAVWCHLRSVSSLGGEGIVHHVFDGEAGHGALSEGNDLIDAFHHRLQLSVSLQRELAADLKTRAERKHWETQGGSEQVWGEHFVCFYCWFKRFKCPNVKDCVESNREFAHCNKLHIPRLTLSYDCH